MDTQSYLERAETLLSPWLDGATRPQANRLDVPVPADSLLAAVATLVENGWSYLVAITGLDPGEATGALQVLYHFAEGAAVVTLRVTVPRDEPHVPTLRDIIPLANVYERELRETLGVAVGEKSAITRAGDRLFLPDDWPDGIYPLRKDFQGLPQ
jgi:Ni,Fe-hydrogenase III component G